MRRWLYRYKVMFDWTDWQDSEGPVQPTPEQYCAAPENFETRAWYAAPLDALLFPKELTPELREVLGWPNFKCGPVAHVMRAAGADIKTRSEDEQAAVLHWLVTMVLTYGDAWWQAASDELRTMQESIKAKKGASA